MVSRREVAVTIWEEPAVREVKMKRAGSVEYVVIAGESVWCVCGDRGSSNDADMILKRGESRENEWKSGLIRRNREGRQRVPLD